MAVAVADISLGARDVGGQPLAVLHGNKPVLTAMPDLDGHPDVAEIKPPASHVRRSVIPPALVARSQAVAEAVGEPLGQLPGQGFSVHGREETLQGLSELLRRRRDSLLPVLAVLAAGRLRVGEEQLYALGVEFAHPVEVVEALDTVGRERCHRRDSDRHVWQQGRAPQGVRAASGYAPDAKPVVPERLGDGADILCSRRHGVTWVGGRAAVARAVIADQADALLLGVGDPPAVQVPGVRRASVDEDRLSMRFTGYLHAKFTPIAGRYGPGLDPAGH